MPIPRINNRRVAVAIRAMAHHKKLAQTVEMIELLCVMLRGYFAECASIPHSFLERHLPEYHRHLASGVGGEPEEEEEVGQEEEGEEGDEEYPSINVAPGLLTHLIRKLAEGSSIPESEVAKVLHTSYGKVTPVSVRASRGRKRPVAGGKRTVSVSQNEEFEEGSGLATLAPRTKSRSSTPRPAKAVRIHGPTSIKALSSVRRLPPRAFRTREDLATAADSLDAAFKAAATHSDANDDGGDQVTPEQTEAIFKTASKKSKKARDMPVLTD